MSELKTTILGLQAIMDAIIEEGTYFETKLQGVRFTSEIDCFNERMKFAEKVLSSSMPKEEMAVEWISESYQLLIRQEINERVRQAIEKRDVEASK